MQKLGKRLGQFLSRPVKDFAPSVSGGLEVHWSKVVQPGDVLLVEGRSRISVAIKYLTQSTWSHACLMIGTRQGVQGELLEADVAEGVISVSKEKYRDYNVRICRPLGLSDEDREMLIQYALARLGNQYDLKNIFDLARYLFPTPPVPVRWRRHLITLGSGEPTRAICSSLIAQAFQYIRYPILPTSWWSSEDPMHRYIIYQARHYSLITPRDFDLSPYFEVVKPTLVSKFDYRSLNWKDREPVAEL